MINEIRNEVITRLVDKIGYQIVIEIKNKHLYDKHKRYRQIDKLKRMTYGRTSKREREIEMEYDWMWD